MNAVISLRVHPRARRTGLSGKLGEAYKLEVTAPADDGKANAACLALLAELTGIPKTRIAIVAGHHNPAKTVRFEGISPEELNKRLEIAL